MAAAATATLAYFLASTVDINKPQVQDLQVNETAKFVGDFKGQIERLHILFSIFMILIHFLCRTL